MSRVSPTRRHPADTRGIGTELLDSGKLEHLVNSARLHGIPLLGTDGLIAQIVEEILREELVGPELGIEERWRPAGLATLVASLTVRGLTNDDIHRHLREVYGVAAPADRIEPMVRAVLRGRRAWQRRELNDVYPVLFLGSIQVPVGHGPGRTASFAVPVGVRPAGTVEVLGLCPMSSDDQDGLWRSILTDLRGRGVGDVRFAVCPSDRGLAAALTATWPGCTVQTCLAHLRRDTFRQVGAEDRRHFATDLRAVYAAPSLAEARAAFATARTRWGSRYPAALSLWEESWSRVTPFFAFDPSARRLVSSTSIIDSLNARFRRLARDREQRLDPLAALDVLYLAVLGNAQVRPDERWLARWAVIHRTLTADAPHRRPADDESTAA